MKETPQGAPRSMIWLSMQSAEKFGNKVCLCPQRWRAITPKSVFCVLHNILEMDCDNVSLTNPILKPYGLPAFLLNVQFHMIAHIDDSMRYTCKPSCTWFIAHQQSKDAIELIKNKELNAPPWQMVLGCMDRVHCVLVRIAFWNPSVKLSSYLFCFLCNDVTAVPGRGQKLNRFYITYWVSTSSNYRNSY
jgi:hypothetical protein